MNQGSTVEHKVRDAVRHISRAVVDLGPEQIQLCAYFDSLVGRHDQRELVLSPIAASALPPRAFGPVRIHGGSDTGGFTLVCRTIRPTGDTTARVTLEGAGLVEGARESQLRQVSAQRALALVVPDGVPGGDAHVFPIVEIGATSCVVDATVPLELGLRLGLVEVVGDKHVLRRSSATVFGVSAWCMADGSRRFRCTLRLRPLDASDQHDLHELVSDPAQVKRVMEFAAMSNARGVYRAQGWGEGSARFAESERGSLLIAVQPTPLARTSPRTLQLGFTLFSVEYQAEVRILEREGAWVRTALPLHLHRARSFRHEHSVAHAPRTPLAVCFENPATGEQERRPVSRISLHTIAFEASATHDLFWEDMPIDRAVLRLDGREITLGDLRVSAVVERGGSRLVEASVARSDAAQNPELAGLVTELGHPEVTVHDGHDFRSILNIYKEAGLFAPHMRTNLDPIMPQAKRVWHAMHRPGADIVQTFVHGSPSEPDGALSIVRPWERTWLVQHFVSVSQRFNGAAGHLQRACVDYIQPRPEGQHLMFFVKSDNRQMNAFFERFLSTTGTPEATERRTVQFWHRPADAQGTLAPASFPQMQVKPLRRADEQTVARAAERVLGVHGAAALAFAPGEFQLDVTRARFARVGLVRKRVCSVVKHKRALCWATATEIASQGFNFTWMLNATWVLPVHPELDPTRDGLRAALANVLAQPTQTPTGDTFLNVVDGVDPGPLREAGFELLAEVYMYTLNRSGLNRYFYYTSDRYGEVDVRTEVRQRRRASSELPSDTRKVV